MLLLALPTGEVVERPERRRKKAVAVPARGVEASAGADKSGTAALEAESPVAEPEVIESVETESVDPASAESQMEPAPELEPEAVPEAEPTTEPTTEPVADPTPDAPSDDPMKKLPKFLRPAEDDTTEGGER